MTSTRIYADFKSRQRSNAKQSLLGEHCANLSRVFFGVLVQTLQERADALQCHLQEALEDSKDLIGHLEPSAAALVQAERRLLSRAVLRSGRALAAKRRGLQVRRLCQKKRICLTKSFLDIVFRPLTVSCSSVRRCSWPRRFMSKRPRLSTTNRLTQPPAEFELQY